MPYENPKDEAGHRRARTERSAGGGRERLRLAAVGGEPISGEGDGAPGIVKPLPPELFIRHETNAEMRWEAMRDVGYHVPNDRFFVRSHTSTPIIDAATWRLELHGTGLRTPRSFSYEELLALPSVTLDVAIECAGNGRSLFATQQDQEVSGTPWRMGGIGVARWRGVPLAMVLERAGLTPDAVDVMPRGLDPDYVADGVDYGRVRRPIPVSKALKDVILAYEMNDQPLPPDHGYPVRLVVPSWIGLASIKWVGDIEVSTSPLTSPWNTEFYRMFGEAYPPEGSAPLTVRGVRSTFELPGRPGSPPGARTCCTEGPGRATAGSPGWRSASTTASPGTVPSCTARRSARPGPAGTSPGTLSRPARTPCSPGRPTRPARSSRCAPRPTTTAIFSTPSYAIR